MPQMFESFLLVFIIIYFVQSVVDVVTMNQNRKTPFQIPSSVPTSAPTLAPTTTMTRQTIVNYVDDRTGIRYLVEAPSPVAAATASATTDKYDNPASLRHFMTRKYLNTIATSSLARIRDNIVRKSLKAIEDRIIERVMRGEFTFELYECEPQWKPYIYIQYENISANHTLNLEANELIKTQLFNGYFKDVSVVERVEYLSPSESREPIEESLQSCISVFFDWNNYEETSAELRVENEKN